MFRDHKYLSYGRMFSEKTLTATSIKDLTEGFGFNTTSLYINKCRNVNCAQ